MRGDGFLLILMIFLGLRKVMCIRVRGLCLVFVVSFFFFVKVNWGRFLSTDLVGLAGDVGGRVMRPFFLFFFLGGEWVGAHPSVLGASFGLAKRRPKGRP